MFVILGKRIFISDSLTATMLLAFYITSVKVKHGIASSRVGAIEF
ncbi:hypothetical protein [Candidatus Clavichlamydia salmonicola]|nr:hypothetical protein [Candidatus Clavichlamydia salmonicola]